MDTLEVALGARSYPIYIGPGILSDPALLARAVTAHQVLIVTNTTFVNHARMRQMVERVEA